MLIHRRRREPFCSLPWKMRLLDVVAVLDWERDIQTVDLEIEVLKELDDNSASYAILSHRWGTEVTFDEITGLTAMKPRKRDDVRERNGYQKNIKSFEQAKRDGYRWLWIDTCCIDRRSGSELLEAIDSMYRGYHNSGMCHVYLDDVNEPAFPTKRGFSRFGKSNGWPEWFSRGWTLQELIAPTSQILSQGLDVHWHQRGTNVHVGGHHKDSDASVERQRGSEETMQIEDRAYSLLVLFGMNVLMLYGEGSKEFQ
ncbi:hypothetical protein F5141DRAFT_612839 [Pisolithus sp. B1]|nr:hypothetical protein F5141DRAFT_612839 [Pisolithus sp. B1]